MSGISVIPDDHLVAGFRTDVQQTAFNQGGADSSRHAHVTVSNPAESRVPTHTSCHCTLAIALEGCLALIRTGSSFITHVAWCTSYTPTAHCAHRHKRTNCNPNLTNWPSPSCRARSRRVRDATLSWRHTDYWRTHAWRGGG